MLFSSSVTGRASWKLAASCKSIPCCPVSETSAVLRPLLSTFSEDDEVACSNSSRETVFAGKREVIDELEVELSGVKIRCTKLQVPFAFHTAQVDPILGDVEEVASIPQIPILSSFLGRPLGLDGRIEANYIRQHCRHTVQFASAMETLQDQGLVNEASVVN
jgi:acyl transferase domain-containing protein